jgi:hypothetical protein
MPSYHKLHAIKCIELLYTISSLMAPWRFPRKFLLREKIHFVGPIYLFIYVLDWDEKSHLNMHYYYFVNFVSLAFCLFNWLSMQVVNFILVGIWFFQLKQYVLILKCLCFGCTLFIYIYSINIIAIQF